LTETVSRLSLHSCNFGILIEWYLRIPCATCIHKCRKCLQVSQGDAGGCLSTKPIGVWMRRVKNTQHLFACNNTSSNVTSTESQRHV